MDGRGASTSGTSTVIGWTGATRGVACSAPASREVEADWGNAAGALTLLVNASLRVANGRALGAGGGTGGATASSGCGSAAAGSGCGGAAADGGGGAGAGNALSASRADDERDPIVGGRGPRDCGGGRGGLGATAVRAPPGPAGRRRAGIGKALPGRGQTGSPAMPGSVARRGLGGRETLGGGFFSVMPSRGRPCPRAGGWGRGLKIIGLLQQSRHPDPRSRAACSACREKPW